MPWKDLEKRRINDRKYREKNREKIRRYHAEYIKKYIRKNPRAYSKSLANSVRLWRKKYPERVRAHRRVFVEIRAGRMKKIPCFCGSRNVEAHHEDYSKPLDVVWLCKTHHRLADLKRRGKELP